MRVLHVNNPANVAWTLTRALRDAGIAADVLDLWPSPHGYPADHRFDARGPLRGALAVPRAAALASQYDVLHLHDCYPLAARIARRRGARVVLHHHGSLLRAGVAPVAPAGAREIVATPDLRALRPGAEYLPAPAPPIAAVPHPARAVPVVGHYPSLPEKKGTAAILAAAQPLADAGRIRLDYATRLTHTEVLARIAACDAVVDQWTPTIGAYGVVGLEAMLTSRPVIVSARPEWYDGLPTLGATLETALAALADRARELPALGEAARRFALRHHDPARIVARLRDLYA